MRTTVLGEMSVSLRLLFGSFSMKNHLLHCWLLTTISIADVLKFVQRRHNLSVYFFCLASQCGVVMTGDCFISSLFLYIHIFYVLRICWWCFSCSFSHSRNDIIISFFLFCLIRFAILFCLKNRNESFGYMFAIKRKQR